MTRRPDPPPRPSPLATWEPFLLASTVLAVLAGLTFLGRSGLPTGSFRPVDIVSSLRESTVADTTPVAAIAALADSVDPAGTDTLPPDSARIAPDLASLDTIGVVPLEGAGDSALAPFFDALERSGHSRIAWFGDSYTEGDILVGDLRRYLQRSFGGTGVGLVPPTSPVARFRGTIHQTFSSGWKERNIMARRGPPIGVGIAGRASMPAPLDSTDRPADWIDFRPADGGAFHKARVFLAGGGDSTDSVKASWAGGSSSAWVGPPGGLRAISIELPGTTAVRLSFPVRDTVAVQAVEMQAGRSGAQIDNFSIRGNSGTGLMQIPLSSLQTTHRVLGYSLVVIQCGVNVADTTMAGFHWYQERLVQVIQRARQAFPGAGVLLVGIADIGVRDALGNIVSNPTVASIRDAQRRAAERTGAAFWDLQKAMGGPNAIARWAAAGMVAADYVHISPQGGRRLAKALHKAFLLSWSHRGATP